MFMTLGSQLRAISFCRIFTTTHIESYCNLKFYGAIHSNSKIYLISSNKKYNFSNK